MRKHFWLLLLLLPGSFFSTSAQFIKIDSVNFFKDDKTIEMTLATDFKRLFADKLKMTPQPATVTFHFPDSSSFTEDITINARGITRKESCKMPPIMLNFKSPSSDKLKKIKMVNACESNAEADMLLLKEFLVYKMYNLLTDMSFRVRLLHVTYQDTKDKIKAYSEYGFLIEDVDVMAKRNHCKEVNKTAFRTEDTHRDQMTLVALFEYMVGNTDWSIPNYHNVKLMRTAGETNTPPYVVPYDFDYCGIVNAYYAVPSELLGTQSVTERVYRGFPRTMDELQIALDNFRKQKENTKNLIMNFTPMGTKYRKEMMDYLDEFYKTIENKKDIQMTFIDGARKD